MSVQTQLESEVKKVSEQNRKLSEQRPLDEVATIEFLINTMSEGNVVCVLLDGVGDVRLIGWQVKSILIGLADGTSAYVADDSNMMT